MRFAIVAAALAGAFVALPAKADPHLFQFEYTAFATGTQIVYDPNATPFCGTPGAPVQACYGMAPFSIATGGNFAIVNEIGTGDFMIGSGCANCFTRSGTVIGGFVNGVQQFSGVNFSYVIGNPSILGSVYATAPAFSVRLLSIDGTPVPGPVPEPATWAMMVIGFGAVGAAMRRRSVRVRFA